MAAWQTRITGYGAAAPGDLRANPANPRRHPAFQREALRAVLGEVGIVAPVLVNARSGFVIDGHARIEEALAAGQPTLPVAYVDLSAAEETLVLATLDRITGLATLDPAAFDALARQIESSAPALQQLLAETSAELGLVPPTDPRAEWQGMPAFEQADLGPVKQVIVSFASVEDMNAFAALVEQTITMQTKSIWYPAQPEIDYGGTVYMADSGDAA